MIAREIRLARLVVRRLCLGCSRPFHFPRKRFVVPTEFSLDSAPHQRFSRLACFDSSRRTAVCHPPGTMTVPLEVKSGVLENVWNHLMITAWLGVVHIAVVVFGIALWCLPKPVACFVLATYAVAAVWPIAPPYPSWGVQMAHAVTNGAVKYFPATLEWEDYDDYVKGAESGVAHLIGLEPHSVLPLSIVTFGKYFYCSPDTSPRCVYTSRGLATPVLFHIPFLRQLWTWLGMDAISKAKMVSLLNDGKTALLIPGGVAECLAMKPGVETVYLRKRFGFVKVAIQTGARLVPAFTFGQSETYNYVRLGPPVCSNKVVELVARVLQMAPMAFWGKCGTFLPKQVPMRTIVGKPIAVVKNENPSNEEVAAKLEEFIDAMERLHETHKERFGYAGQRLVVL